MTFRAARGSGRAGALIDDGTRVLDLQAAHRARYGQASPRLASVLAIVEGGNDAVDLVHALVAAKRRPKPVVLARESIKLGAPIPRPPQMRDFLCFEKHLVQAFEAARKLRARTASDPDAALREMEAKGILAVPQTWYERPIFYHPNRFSVCGHEDDVPWPGVLRSTRLRARVRLLHRASRQGHRADRARDHVFGYTIFNDFSARDEQTKEMPGQLGPGKGKDFDNANAMGPCLVTADEIPDPYALEMKVRVNGEEWGRGNSRDMKWKFEDCIAHVARSETLHPGEFFGSGTVGNGCGLEQLRFLTPGDVVELEVERIGVLRNRVVKP